MSHYYSNHQQEEDEEDYHQIRAVDPYHFSQPLPYQQHDERPPSFHSSDAHHTHNNHQSHRYQSEDHYEERDDDEDDGPIRVGNAGYAVTDDGTHHQQHQQQQQADLSYDGEMEWDEKSGDIEGQGFGGYGAYIVPPDHHEIHAGAEDDEDGGFQGGFGAPPTGAQLRRNRTRRRVKLTEGNLVLDCIIPTRLRGFLPKKDEAEYQYSRYTAVTGGPETFNASNFILRPTLYDRRTELMIVVTMYNEDEVLFCRTMHGIMENIAHLCTRNKSKTWGKDAWKKIVVCIVADGRKAVHPRVLDCLSALGVYQDGVAKNRVDEKDVSAHLFEYTTQLSVDPKLKFRGLEKGILPTQILFCLKEQNAKKLNSHRWALEAFAPQLAPNVVMLIDVGTLPGPKSIYHLWKTFDLNSNVGGAAGEIVAMKGKWWSALLLNPLVAAQNFEYKISNILDKTTESVFGYITVLPGAFSAYRYRALLNDAMGHGPLNSYFKGEHLAGYDADIFTSNMYLAEDRILCWELVAKAGENWVLKYVKSAQGETDVPDQVAEFISQRRRWLNGSFFASIYALTHFTQLFRTTHSFGKKSALLFQAMYNALNLLFAWFGMANYWIFFMILTSSLEDPSFHLKGIKYANTIVQYLYMGTVLSSFVFSMGNRPKASKWKYLTAMVLFALTTAYMLGAAGFCLYHAIKQMDNSLVFTEIVISLVSTYGSYTVASLVAGDPWHLVTSFVQYLLFAPIYINLLNVYAFSNLHDFSWGTKDQQDNIIDLGVAASSGSGTVEVALPSGQADIDGSYNDALDRIKSRPKIVPKPLSAKDREAATRDYYASLRTDVLLVWILTNALLVCVILAGDYSSTFADGGNGRTKVYLAVILVFVALMSAIRLFGALSYFALWLIAG